MNRPRRKTKQKAEKLESTNARNKACQMVTTKIQIAIDDTTNRQQSLTIIRCFHRSRFKRRRKHWICAQKARNNQHTFNRNLLQLKEDTHKNTKTEENKLQNIKILLRSQHIRCQKQSKTDVSHAGATS